LKRLHRVRAWCAAVIILAPGVSAQALAQSPRIVVAVNGAVQSSAPALSDRFEFDSSVETAIVDLTYPARAAVLIDAGIGVRVWRRIGVGLAVSRATRRGAAEVDARLPHPLLFAQPRTVAGSQPGLDTTETAAHLQLLYAIEATPGVTLVLSGGPSVMQVRQELVTDVKYSETYPFDEAAFTSAGTRRSSASATGFNAGADVRWMFAPSVGIGVLVRYSRARVDLDGADRSLGVRGGGVQAGVGLRLAF
jgi:hypothetical protein